MNIFWSLPAAALSVAIFFCLNLLSPYYRVSLSFRLQGEISTKKDFHFNPTRGAAELAER